MRLAKFDKTTEKGVADGPARNQFARECQRPPMLGRHRPKKMRVHPFGWVPLSNLADIGEDPIENVYGVRELAPAFVTLTKREQAPALQGGPRPWSIPVSSAKIERGTPPRVRDEFEYRLDRRA